jgi:hypothetical protein
LQTNFFSAIKDRYFKPVGVRMSVSHSVSSFSPTAYFKDWHVPAIALLTGLAIGGTFSAIDDLKRIINDINMDDSGIKKGVLDRVKIVFTACSATASLATFGLMSRHPGFGISAVASLGVSIVVMLNIKWDLQKKSSSFQADTQAKLARAVKSFFEITIPAIALLTFTFLLDSLDLSRRN